MTRGYHNPELRSIQGRAAKVGNFRTQCAIQENVIAFQVPVDNLVCVNKVKRMRHLLAPLKSLLETNVPFVLVKVLEYTLIAGILESNSSLDWSEVLKEAFVPTLLCEALIDFPFNFDVG